MELTWSVRDHRSRQRDSITLVVTAGGSLPICDREHISGAEGPRRREVMFLYRRASYWQQRAVRD
jgi:hypothetical protein